MRAVLALALLILTAPTAAAQEVVVEAQAAVTASNHRGLEEVFLTPDVQLSLIHI